MLFHDSNITRKWVIKDKLGKIEPVTITYITADHKSYRVNTEVNGEKGCVYDYDFDDIMSADAVTLSDDGGITWFDMPIHKTFLTSEDELRRRNKKVDP